MNSRLRNYLNKHLLFLLTNAKLLSKQLKFDDRQLNALIGEVTASVKLKNYNPCSNNEAHIDAHFDASGETKSVSVKRADDAKCPKGGNNQLTFSVGHKYDYAFVTIENKCYLVPKDDLMPFVKNISRKKDRIVLTNKFMKFINKYYL